MQILLSHPALYQVAAVGHELEARGVARKAGHAILIIVIILVVVGILLGAGLTALLRRRR